MAEEIWVEVVLALAETQHLVRLRVPEGTTAAQALLASGLPESHAEYIGNSPILGIYGKKIQENQILSAEDRVEIYRPLLIDPKENRRLRVRKKNETH